MINYLIDEIELIAKNKISYMQYPNKLRGIKLPRCVMLSVVSKNRMINSWGIDNNINDASLKAVAELLERLIFDSLSPTHYFKVYNKVRREFSREQIQVFNPQYFDLFGTTTNGVAIHTTLNLAMENALNEILERHVILYALNNDTKPIYEKNFNVKIINKFSSILDIDLSFYYWKGPLKRKIAISVLKSKNFKGAHYGFGSSCDLKKALNKSYNEIIGMIPSMSKDIDHTKRKCNNIHQEIQNYHLHNKNKFYDSFFDKKNLRQSQDITPNLSFSDFYYAQYENFYNYEKKYYCVKCVSPLTQQLIFKPWGKAIVNPLLFQNINKDLQDEYSIIS